MFLEKTSTIMVLAVAGYGFCVMNTMSNNKNTSSAVFCKKIDWRIS